jgi:hypothetical protein
LLNEMTQYIKVLRLCIGISPPLGEYQGMVQTTREPPGRVDEVEFIDTEDIWVRAKILANLDGDLEEKLVLQKDTTKKTSAERLEVEVGAGSSETQPLGMEKGACDTEIETLWVRTKQSASQRFAQAAEGNTEGIAVPEDYKEEYQGIFEKKASEGLPEKRLWDHKIILKEGYERRHEYRRAKMT